MTIKPRTSEDRVKARFPKAQCLMARTQFQIWDVMFSWAGTKLGSGSTEAAAWRSAEKTIAEADNA